MPAILFVCTANQFRSPLAAACLAGTLNQTQLTGQWIIESAGAWTTDGSAAPEITRQIARQLGLAGLDRHRTRSVTRALLEKYDLILVMEANQKEALRSEFPGVCSRVFLLSEVVDGIPYDFPDPAFTRENPLEIALDLCSRITKGTEKILRLAESLSHASLV